jgi:hypothetical protein
MDGVEVHREGRVQRVVRLAGVLDAWDAKVGRVVARVQHDSAQGLPPGHDNERQREPCQLLGDEEGVAAAANVEHAVVVQVEAGLEAVVGAEDLHREPGGHDLGDGRRHEGPIGVLSHQFVALLVHHEHQRLRGQRRSLSRAPARAWAGCRSRATAKRRAPVATAACALQVAILFDWLDIAR